MCLFWLTKLTKICTKPSIGLPILKQWKSGRLRENKEMGKELKVSSFANNYCIFQEKQTLEPCYTTVINQVLLVLCFSLVLYFQTNFLKKKIYSFDKSITFSIIYPVFKISFFINYSYFIGRVISDY